MGQLLDRVGVEGDQPVEARDQGDPFRLAPQLVPGALGRGFLELFGERLEGALVDRPGVVGEWDGHGRVAPGEWGSQYRESVVAKVHESEPSTIDSAVARMPYCRPVRDLCVACRSLRPRSRGAPALGRSRFA